MNEPSKKKKTIYLTSLSAVYLFITLLSCGLYTAFSRRTSGETPDLNNRAAYSEAVASRAERLDRSLIAMSSGEGVYLSWRLFHDEDAVFGTSDEAVFFTVMRDGQKIAVVSDSTDYYDPDGSPDSSYTVVSSPGDISGSVSAFGSGHNYFDIELSVPPVSEYGIYTVNDISAGDLNGDGVLDLVVKWDCGGKDNSAVGHTGNVLLDAYSLDGTKLWPCPIDLGVNVRAGAHYTQFLVFDFDGDGKSEVICQTAPGSVDACGSYVTSAGSPAEIQSCDNSVDCRNSDGYILDSDEFITVFSGETGQAIDTVYYPNQRISPEIWGDSQGNRQDRFTAAVAYMDGTSPYAVYMRGYYQGRNGMQRQSACALAFDGEHLSCHYSFDTYNPSAFPDKSTSASFYPDGTYKGTDGYSFRNRVFTGEGNHNCVSADIDGDGKDEVITGALCYEVDTYDRFSVRWCTFLGHGDAIHLADYDQTHPGYELLTCHEETGADPYFGTERNPGISLIDPNNGDVLLHLSSSDDTGRCMFANLGISGTRYQLWGESNGIIGCSDGGTAPKNCLNDSSFADQPLENASTNFRIFWDSDVYDELLDRDPSSVLHVYSWTGDKLEPIFTTEGCSSINGTKANPCLQADIIGDWREEIIMATEDGRSIRVFTSDIPTDRKIMSLFQDPVYRLAVASQQTAYNQPPHIGFYLAPECFDIVD